MKKLIVLGALGCLVMLGIMSWDYHQNNRSAHARLHTVSVSVYQEQMKFSAPVQQQGTLYLMSGAVRKIDNITPGAVATVSHQGNTYRGTLIRLDPAFDGIFYATVSVEGMKQRSNEDATAVILGNLRQDVMFVPTECLITDEAGQDAVFVVQNGYAALRKVQTGDVPNNGMQQILEGLFPSETIIISPQNIRTGDRILPP